MLDFIVQRDGLHKDTASWHHLFGRAATRRAVMEIRAQRAVSLWGCARAWRHRKMLRWKYGRAVAIGPPGSRTKPLALKSFWEVCKPSGVRKGGENSGVTSDNYILKNYTVYMRVGSSLVHHMVARCLIPRSVLMG